LKKKGLSTLKALSVQRRLEKIAANNKASLAAIAMPQRIQVFMTNFGRVADELSALWAPRRPTHEQ
jgi:hypothetical protein